MAIKYSDDVKRAFEFGLLTAQRTTGISLTPVERDLANAAFDKLIEQENAANEKHYFVCSRSGYAETLDDIGPCAVCGKGLLWHKHKGVPKIANHSLLGGLNISITGADD